MREILYENIQKMLQNQLWRFIFFGRFKDPWNRYMVRKGCNFNDCLISYGFFCFHMWKVVTFLVNLNWGLVFLGLRMGDLKTPILILKSPIGNFYQPNVAMSFIELSWTYLVQRSLKLYRRWPRSLFQYPRMEKARVNTANPWPAGTKWVSSGMTRTSGFKFGSRVEDL